MKRTNLLLSAVFFLFAAGLQNTQAKEKPITSAWDPARIKEIYAKQPKVLDDIWSYNQYDERDHIAYTCKHLQYFYLLYPEILSAEQNKAPLDMLMKRILDTFSSEGQTLVSSLLYVFDIPLETRARAPACGDVIIRWDDGITLASVISEVLDTSGIHLGSLGLTINDLRMKLTADVGKNLELLAKNALKYPDLAETFRAYLRKAMESGFPKEAITFQQQIEWKNLIDGALLKK